METKENLHPIVVGQVLYREIYNRYNEPSEIKEYTVKRIGKKYFYLNGWEERYPVSKDTLRYEDKTYSQSSFQLYRDKQEILDRVEKDNLYRILRNYFDWSSNYKKSTLQQLRDAVNVLGLK